MLVKTMFDIFIDEFLYLNALCIDFIFKRENNYICPELDKRFQTNDKEFLYVLIYYLLSFTYFLTLYF